MKKLDWLLIRSFLGPLAITFFLAVFVLLMQFLWKYIDDLVGKGLDLWVIFQLLFYASAVSIPMALPIATLFASIMTMGNFGEKYELVAMKAAGISLSRIMRPLTILSVLITISAFFLSNYAMPYATLKYKTLLVDVTKKKPVLSIKPNEYYAGLDNFIIRVQEKGKGKEENSLKGVLIYDHSDQMGNNNVTYAKKGKMYTTQDQRFLYLNLSNGYNYSEALQGNNYIKRPLNRLYFKEQSRRFDLSSFAFTKTDEENYKDHYKMLNIHQLKYIEDSLENNLGEQRKMLTQRLFSRFPNYDKYFIDTLQTPKNNALSFYKSFKRLSQQEKKIIISLALQEARNTNEEVIYNSQFQRTDEEFYHRHSIERHKKFTLSLACVLLFLIGAPFGSIIRKGGLGLPLVASVLIFVLYYILSMVGEKAVREGAMHVWVGMWGSTYILLILGIFLTLKATSDSPLFDMEIWKKRWNTLSGKFMKNKSLFSRNHN